MALADLAGLGLPAWLVIAAAIVFILKQVGMLDFIADRLKQNDLFEQEQIEARTAADQSEQMALWSQMTQLQTKSLDQNELLLEYIIHTSDGWHTKHSKQMEEMLSRQQSIVYELRQVGTKLTIMVGIIEKQYDKSNGK